MNLTDLAFTPALEQAELIRTKQVSPLELVELYLERIQQLDRQLGSYFYLMADSAIAEAKQKTEYLANLSDHTELPPFFGVPISIKDLNPVANVPCSYGVAALRQQLATYDDGIVTRIKLAGFTILGKTAAAQLGSLPYTEPEGFPPSRNPWNLDYTSGGSSGGAAAAVAAGLCAIAQGSDGGGSIRGPASCCGIVGIKPSRGRVSQAPVGDRLSGLATDGPLARTVADAAALLDVMSGYIPGDPYWLSDPNPAFVQVALNPEPFSQPLKIAFSTTIPPLGEIAPACQQAVENTVQLLASFGHIVEPGCPDFTELVEPFTAIWQSNVPAAGIPGELLEEMNRWLLSRAISAGDYLQAVGKMQWVSRQIVSFFETVDVLVLPVFMHPTIRVGEWAHLSPAETLQKIVSWIAPCPPFNASGQPAIALPMSLEGGLPLGVQLIGKPAAEATLIALAAQIEAAQPWRDRRPPFAQ